MKFFERFYPFLTAAIIILLVIYLSPTDLTGRYDKTKAMSSLDTDNDEALSKSEIENVSSLFSKLDANNDGSIQFTECTDHLDLAMVLDTDKDEILSSEELSEASQRLLARDKNADGALSLKELK